MKRLIWIDDERQRVVPVEPTARMLEAVSAQARGTRSAYREMLAVAPAVEEAQPVTDERAAFEKEFSGYRLTRGANGLYDNPATGFAWKVWQARATLAASAVEGEPHKKTPPCLDETLINRAPHWFDDSGKPVHFRRGNK